MFVVKSIKTCGDLSGKRVLLRLALDVPVASGQITDSFRLTSSYPTIDFLLERGATVIIIGHRQDNKTDKSVTLEPVYEFFKIRYPSIKFIKGIGEAKEILSRDVSGISIIENLRFDPGEKANSDDFSKNLADLADIYVNDAFSVSHRKHASIVGVPKFLPSYAGLAFMSEVENLSKVFNPTRPMVAVLGGSKFSTKLPLIEKFMKTADQVFVAGALANDFFRHQGYEIGRSMASDEPIYFDGLSNNPKLFLPPDAVVENAGKVLVKRPEQVILTDRIVDAGPETLKVLRQLVSSAGLVVWNGPLGSYEEGFSQGTDDLIRAIAESSGESIVGGGDTASMIDKLGLSDRFSFLSTAGGAMLDFLANETLPGIEAIQKN